MSTTSQFLRIKLRSHRQLRTLAELAAFALSLPCFAQPGIVAPGEIVWWGEPDVLLTPPPPGVYKALAIAGHALALRPDGTMVAWGYNSAGQATPQPGRFTAVAAGFDHSVALREDGVAVSWGQNLYGESVTPPGTFVQVAAGKHTSAGIRTDGSIHVWGGWAGSQPAGNDFRFVSASSNAFVALRTDGTMVTWANMPPPLPGTFLAVNAGAYFPALQTDGTVVGGVSNWPNSLPPPAGRFIQLSLNPGAWPGALREDFAIAVWGPPLPSILNPPSGRFSFVAMGNGLGFALKPCYANCDESSASPYLTANDFLCFLNKYAAAEPSANCDGSTTGALLTANDFVCFLNAFASGCQ